MIFLKIITAKQDIINWQYLIICNFAKNKLTFKMPKLPKLFIYILAALFVINILQSYFTELIFDESYYWYYAQNMAWGYFDHPPMVALLIKISSLLFSGELGVRFMSCLLSIGTYFFNDFIKCLRIFYPPRYSFTFLYSSFSIYL